MTCRRQISNGRTGEMLLSRYLMEHKLERKLVENEVVHHKDGNMLNDNIDNLEVMTKQDHNILHGINGSKRRRHQEGMGWCSRCQQFLPKECFGVNLREWNGLSKYCKKCKREYENRWRKKVKEENL